MKKIEEKSLCINKKNSFNRFEKICYCGFSLIVIVLYYLNFKIFKNDIFIMHKKIYTLVYFIISILITFIIYYLINYCLKNKNKEIYRIFFVITFILGNIYSLLTPLFAGSDEEYHFYRIYEIASGNLITPKIKENVYGSNMPMSIELIKGNKGNYTKYIDTVKSFNLSLEKNKTMSFGNYYGTTSIYPFVQYLPQSIIVALARILNLKPTLIAYIARYSGFIFWLFMCTYAIKIIPCKKNFLFLLLISPASISFATVMSGDTVTNACIIVFISYIYKLINDNKILKIKDYIIIFILSIMISMCKLVFLPIIGLGLLVNKELFGGIKKKYIIGIILVLTVLVFSLGWLAISSRYMSSSNKTFLQKEWIKYNPVMFLFVIIRTYLNNFVVYIQEIVAGNQLYHSQLNVPSFINFGYFVTLILGLFSEDNKIKFKNIDKIWIVNLLFLIVLLISTALYIQCTAWNKGIGYPYIDGIQGRYFIPVVMLLLFINNKKIDVKKEQLIITNILLTLPIYILMLTTFMF